MIIRKLQGSILAVDYSELAIDVDGRAQHSDLFIPSPFLALGTNQQKHARFNQRDDPTDLFQWPIKLLKLNQTVNYRLLVNTWGTPIEIANTGEMRELEYLRLRFLQE